MSEWLIVLIVFLFWVACGVITYGRTLATFQRSYPRTAKKFRTSDLKFSLFMGVLGPVGLLADILDEGVFTKHGFFWWPK